MPNKIVSTYITSIADLKNEEVKRILEDFVFHKSCVI